MEHADRKTTETMEASISCSAVDSPVGKVLYSFRNHERKSFRAFDGKERAKKTFRA